MHVIMRVVGRTEGVLIIDVFSNGKTLGMATLLRRGGVFIAI